MSTTQRRQPTSVVERLLDEPHRFEFFQAVRQLERWFVREEGLVASAVLSERVLFRNSLSLAFPASEIAAFKVAVASEVTAEASGAAAGSRVKSSAPSTRDIRTIEMTPAFIGLLGAGGSLPIFYTELFAQRELLDKDPAARAFLDVFLHRAVVQFYQAWRKHRLSVQFESDRRNRFLPLVLAFAGLGQSSIRDRLRANDGGIADDTLAYFAGALQQRPVSVSTIGRVLAKYFGVAVELEPFVGRWYTLPTGNQTALGIDNAGLGQGAVVGQRLWQRDLRMRLTLGPMPRRTFGRFLPGGPAELALREWLTLLTGVTLEYEVRLVLRSADVRPAQLGGTDGARLGWDSFVLSEAASEHRSDAGYDVHPIA